ncbi:ATP-binding protein [Zunongwangia sp.]|uniref:GAF domain-containing sensor histidine kinase n=1 Tax=Zunongwangia sp. TaxID=1965325 RepID=UPI003AA7DA15
MKGRAGLSTDLKKDVEDINMIPGIQKLLRVIRHSSKMGFVAIARVTEDRWVTCVSEDKLDFGLKPGDELDVETTICYEIREHNIPVIINDVANNFIFKKHCAPKLYGFKSYISYPIFKKNGEFFGTLCAIDSEPRSINVEEVRTMFELYTDLISFHLESIKELERTNSALNTANKTKELKEIFMSIVGKDLAKPVNTVRENTENLLGKEFSPQTKDQLRAIKSSSLKMQDLINNLQSYAKMNLENNLELDLQEDNLKLKYYLTEIIDSLSSLYNHKNVDYDISLTSLVNCDLYRISQLFHNVLDNAMKYGDPEENITIRVLCSSGNFIISVINSGRTIPEFMHKNIFKPYVKQNSKNNIKHLGLGLYVAHEIAKAHNGSMDFSSEDGQTIFSFKMPLNQKSRRVANQ